MIDVLIADDERPALDELEFLLRRDPRIGALHRASSGAEALRLISRHRLDAVFLDIHMPGLSGLELAAALQRFAERPAVVFVTADEQRALEAFDLEAADYLLKPVREERLTSTVTRLIARAGERGVESGAEADAGPAGRDEIITVTVGSSLRRLRRSDVRVAQAQGDYARLHTDTTSYLLRVPLSELAEQWADAGFLRVHRSYLVAVDRVTGLRLGASPTVTIGELEIPISRRMLPAVRDALARGAR